MNRIYFSLVVMTLCAIVSVPVSKASVNDAPSPSGIRFDNLTPKFGDREAWRNVLHWSTECETGFQKQADYPSRDWSGLTLHPVGDSEYIVFVHCWLGPYWTLSELFFVKVRDEKRLTAKRLQLTEIVQEENGKFREQTVATISGSFPAFNRETRRLINLKKFRGPGDCGYYYEYIFKNDEFTLAEARLQECSSKIAPIEEWKRIH